MRTHRGAYLHVRTYIYRYIYKYILFLCVCKQANINLYLYANICIYLSAYPQIYSYTLYVCLYMQYRVQRCIDLVHTYYQKCICLWRARCIYLHQRALDFSVRGGALRKAATTDGVDLVHENDTRLMVSSVCCSTCSSTSRTSKQAQQRTAAEQGKSTIVNQKQRQ